MFYGSPCFPPLNNKKKQKFSRNCELKSSFEGGGRTDMFSDLQVYISQFWEKSKNCVDIS